MREQSGRRPGRYGKPGKKKGGRNNKNRFGGNGGGGVPNGNRAPSNGGGNGYRNVNGNRAGSSGAEMGVCLKCGHPAPDGKLCGFHRSLLNTFRKENPEQDPRRNKFW